MSSLSLLSPRPGELDRESFLESYGGVYESAPWVAEAVWPEAAQENLDAPAAMGAAMRAVVDAAGEEQQLALLRAHPELAGRAAIAGELTDASTREQAGAGLDRCAPEEFEEFLTLNARYNEKFGFPFIIAVAGLSRADILAAFRARLNNSRKTEFETALNEVHKIAALRLAAGAGSKEAS
ncbi:MAG: 2-oxo-4-hydroxy-4-carboxy-5-ureidoimidazoline decarboxylase [Parvularculaceae bacterium]